MLALANVTVQFSYLASCAYVAVTSVVVNVSAHPKPNATKDVK
jgi:hypothetical protein